MSAPSLALRSSGQPAAWPAPRWPLALSLLVGFGMPALAFVPCLLELSAPVLWLLQFVLLARSDLHRDPVLWRRLAALLGATAVAWLLLGSTMQQDLALLHSAAPTGIPGCQILAYGGWPWRGIAGHGGGGWREFHHLASCGFVFAANVLTIGVVLLGLLRLLPARWQLAAWLVAFGALIPAWLIGFARVFAWWD